MDTLNRGTVTGRWGFVLSWCSANQHPARAWAEPRGRRVLQVEHMQEIDLHSVNTFPFLSHRDLEICPSAWPRPTFLCLTSLIRKAYPEISFCPSVMSGPALARGSSTLWLERWVTFSKSLPQAVLCDALNPYVLPTLCKSGVGTS